MSQTNKIAIGVAVAAALLIFAVMYGRFMADTPSSGTKTNVSQEKSVKSPVTESAVVVPATSDAAVDDILKAVDQDDQSLEDEASGEVDSVKSEGEEMNNFSQTYDENEL